jgi:uncharacterized protein (TIGR02145 family)
MTAYIIKSSLSLLLLFGIYWFLLRKEKLFRFNRFFLIFSVILSLIIPVITIPVYTTEVTGSSEILTAINSKVESFNTLPEEREFPVPQLSTSASQSSEERYFLLNPGVILFLLYLAGAVIFSFRFIRNLLYIRRQVSGAKKLTYSGYKIALTEEHVNPYCFINTIVVNREDYHDGRISSRLLEHELEHIRQFHSSDIIFLELIRIVYWFNPVLLLYNYAVRMNHEYLADSGAINEPADIRIYAENLIGFICHRNNVRLTSGFNPSLTRKRLVMLARSNPGKTAECLRIIVTASAVVVVFLMISCVKSGVRSTGQVKDIDGNVYKTVTLGKQEWMAENMKTTRYNDGEMIPLVTDSVLWEDYKPAFCWYNNDEAAFRDKYGALYNWYAVNTYKLCPAGWHVPDMIEFWMILPDYLTNNGYGLGASGREIAKALASNKGWRPDTTSFNIGTNPATNNTSGFTAIPTGIRSYTGEFYDEGEFSLWWSSDSYNEYVGKGFSLANYYSRIMPMWRSKRDGFSLRCVKDVTDPQDYADLTGEWELNLQKSSHPSNEIAQTLSIIHKGDKITLHQKLPLTTMGFDDRKYSYILNGNETVDRIDSAIITTSAKWSPGKQSFTITENMLSSYNGKKLESSTDRTYFMLDNGKSLVVYSGTSFKGHYVPPEDTERTAYYDRR